MVSVKKDDIFKISVTDGVKIFVEGREMFLAEIGQSGQNVAVELTKRLKNKL
jgi:flagellar motor switch protein FliM